MSQKEKTQSGQETKHLVAVKVESGNEKSGPSKGRVVRTGQFRNPKIHRKGN